MSELLDEESREILIDRLAERLEIHIAALKVLREQMVELENKIQTIEAIARDLND